MEFIQMRVADRKTKSPPRQSAFEFKGRRKGKTLKEHGGEDHEKRRARKAERPFDPAKRLHVTLRSSQATGDRSLLHPSRSRIVKGIVTRAAGRHGVILCSYVCVGNHLHLLIQTKSARMHLARPALRAFLREISGLIARLMTGAKKGVPASDGKFWDHLAWSRIVEWGRDLGGVQRYFEKNIREFIWILPENNWPSPELPP